MLSPGSHWSNAVLCLLVLLSLVSCQGRQSAIETCLDFQRDHPQLTLFPNNTEYSSINQGKSRSASCHSIGYVWDDLVTGT